MSAKILGLRILMMRLLAAVCLMAAPLPAVAAGLQGYLGNVEASDLVPGADHLGEPQGEPPVAPAYAGDDVVGYVFLNSDFTNATGYSGRPIDILAGVSTDGTVSGVTLMEHHEPIVLIGIPEKRIREYIQGIVGYNAITMTAPVETGEPDIISGATVTVLVMYDSVTRAAAKVARTLGLGGLDAAGARPAVQVRDIDLDQPVEIKDWQTLLGEGSVRRLNLTVGQVNEAFAQSGDPVAARRPEKGAPEDTFIDLHVADVSVPTVGRSLLGENEWRNLQQTLEEGQSALLVMGQGRYSFKGSAMFAAVSSTASSLARTRHPSASRTASTNDCEAWRRRAHRSSTKWGCSACPRMWSSSPPRPGRSIFWCSVRQGHWTRPS